LPANRPAQPPQFPLLNPHLPTEYQGIATPPTQIPPPLTHQAMTLCRKREIAVGARALVDVTGHATAFDVVGVAAVGRQFVNTAHDQLPLFAVRLNAVAEQLMGDQVRDFMGDGLLEKIFGVSRYNCGLKRRRFSCRCATPAFCPRSLRLTTGRLKGRLKKDSAC